MLCKTTHFLTNDVLPSERKRGQLNGGANHYLYHWRMRTAPHTGYTGSPIDAQKAVAHTLVSMLIPYCYVLNRLGLKVRFYLEMYINDCSFCSQSFATCISFDINLCVFHVSPVRCLTHTSSYVVRIWQTFLSLKVLNFSVLQSALKSIYFFKTVLNIKKVNEIIVFKTEITKINQKQKEKQYIKDV